MEKDRIIEIGNYRIHHEGESYTGAKLIKIRHAGKDAYGNPYWTAVESWFNDSTLTRLLVEALFKPELLKIIE